jgi:hypothetical protein
LNNSTEEIDSLSDPDEELADFAERMEKKNKKI